MNSIFLNGINSCRNGNGSSVAGTNSEELTVRRSCQKVMNNKNSLINWHYGNRIRKKANKINVTSLRRLFEIVYSRMFKIWLHPDIIFKNTQLGRDQRECIKYVHGLTDDVSIVNICSCSLRSYLYRFHFLIYCEFFFSGDSTKEASPAVQWESSGIKWDHT